MKRDDLIKSRKVDKELSKAMNAIAISNTEIQPAEEGAANQPKLDANSEGFKCSKCPMSYKRKNALSSHIKNKHNSELITCGLCGEGFVENDRLTKHMKISHECKHCLEQFEDLKSQTLTHLICLTCGKNFDKVWKTTKHMKTHASSSII